MVHPQGFETTITLGLAGQDTLDARWTVHGGIQYDELPTTDALRNTSIPDRNLTLAGG